MNDDSVARAKKSLTEINKTIASLDPAIRLAAFELLAPLYFREDAPLEPNGRVPPKAPKHAANAEDREGFFAALTHTKAADNVNQIAAWLYSQHGLSEMSAKQIREIASDVGLTIPERPDNTMRFAKKSGKTLYRQKNTGWQLTVNGEAHLKETYSVRKGNKPLTDGGSS
jgi:hypothetical protein